MILLDPTSRPELWFGAMDWLTEDDSWQATRVPRALLRQIRYAPDLAAKLTEPAGVRLRASTDADLLQVTASTDLETVLDLVDARGEIQRHPLLPGRNDLRLRLTQPGTIELWLPQGGQLRLHEVSVAEGCRVTEAAPHAQRWLTYGSSISQCTAAAGPSQTWPAVVSRELGWDLTCLGVGGQCHLDPCVPDAIETGRFDVVSLCLGINVYGPASFGPRSWRPQVAGLLARVRRSQPGAQIVMISPIVSPDRDDVANAVGMTLADYRDQVHQVARDAVEDGDAALHLVDGRDLIGPGEEHLLHDRLHPGPEGYAQMGRRLAERWRGMLAS